MAVDIEGVVVETGENPEGCVVWLHGLGADGHDFEPIVPHLRVSSALRYIFPHAPVRPITINGGMSMRAWYDIVDFDRNAAQDESGIRESAQLAMSIMEHQVANGIPWNKIVLAGFSQGGAIALHTLGHLQHKLAGVMALSTYVPLREEFQSSDVSINHDTPIFVAHGQMDPVLPESLGQEAYEILVGKGFQPSWRSYAMAHNVCPEEIVDIGTWLATIYDA